MIYQQGVDVIARESRFDQPARFLQETVRQVYKTWGAQGKRVANALHGTWLGHPFHPAATDIAIGAWTASTGLDLFDALTPRRLFAPCADAALFIGLAGGVASAASGLTDWQHTSGEPRRVGLVHGLLNLGAIALQATSLALRAVGARRAGRLLSSLTFGGLVVSAYLGGELVGKYRIGVNRAPVEREPAGFVPVMAYSDLPENELRRVDVNGVPVLLVRRGDRIYALHETCTHLGGPLSDGALVDGAVQCPWHGSRFALDDGHVVGGPAAFPERCFATRVQNGQIQVGPGGLIGQCQHQPVTTPEAQRMAAVPASH